MRSLYIVLALSLSMVTVHAQTDTTQQKESAPKQNSFAAEERIFAGAIAGVGVGLKLHSSKKIPNFLRKREQEAYARSRDAQAESTRKGDQQSQDNASKASKAHDFAQRLCNNQRRINIVGCLGAGLSTAVVVGAVIGYMQAVAGHSLIL